MPGYVLVELANIKPHKAGGITPFADAIGILDFLRELGEEPFPFPKFTELRVVGLEEALFAARPHDRDAAVEIHRRLDRAARSLHDRLMTVQVVFTGEIVRGADLVVKYRGASLPIGFIFNHPPRYRDGSGNPYYPMEFHLSSP